MENMGMDMNPFVTNLEEQISDNIEMEKHQGVSALAYTVNQESILNSE